LSGKIECQTLFKLYSDIAIIEGVRNQDEKILKWLYKVYLPDVKKYILNNKGTEEDVSDVFQDTIIILYKKAREDGIEISKDLKGYFFGIAKNVWKDQLRRISMTTELTIDVALPDDTDDQKNIQLEILVARAFQKLKPDQQQILNLYSEGESYENIAEKMDLKNETYARRKKYLTKETLLEYLKEDPEYQEYLRLLK